MTAPSDWQRDLIREVGAADAGGERSRPGDQPANPPAPARTPGPAPARGPEPVPTRTPDPAAPTRPRPPAPEDAPGRELAPRAPGEVQRPAAVPEPAPVADPRLLLALGAPRHGDALARRAGAGLRRLAAPAAKEAGDAARLAEAVQQPVTTGRVLAVTSLRGGAGKSTVAALLTRTYAHYRHDPVLGLEADAALGTLPLRLGARTVRWTVGDLADVLTPETRLTDVAGYLVQLEEGGWLLPASRGQVGNPLAGRTYYTVALALRRHFGVTVVDCDSLPGQVARTALGTAHARVLVAPATAEGVHGTRQVLDWLLGLLPAARENTVVVLNATSPDATLDPAAAREHLAEPGVPVVLLPYDRHLGQGGPVHADRLGEAARGTALRLAAEALGRAVRTR
ncbi:AAA family ATPase [Streptomyces sp. CH6]|uniref:AAA family ATPase n=2 Tax=Streptomyces TaxID=1883 RepID=UPI003D089E60